MFCPKCEIEVDEDDIFCNCCGSAINPDSPIKFIADQDSPTGCAILSSNKIIMNQDEEMISTWFQIEGQNPNLLLTNHRLFLAKSDKKLIKQYNLEDIDEIWIDITQPDYHPRGHWLHISRNQKDSILFAPQKIGITGSKIDDSRSDLNQIIKTKVETQIEIRKKELGRDSEEIKPFGNKINMDDGENLIAQWSRFQDEASSLILSNHRLFLSEDGVYFIKQYNLEEIEAVFVAINESTDNIIGPWVQITRNKNDGIAFCTMKRGLFGAKLDKTRVNLYEEITNSIENQMNLRKKEIRTYQRGVTNINKSVNIHDSIIQRSNIGDAYDRISICPYCGKDLNFPKPPKFCPFCTEQISP